MLAAAASACGGNTALVCGEERLSYHDYAACVAAFAFELQGRGDTGRVALLLRNSLDICIATFAVQAAGAQVVPLNPDYTAYELQPILEDAAPSLVLHEAGDVAVLPVLQALGIPGIAIGPGARRLIVLPDSVRAMPLPDPADLSTLQYTGGTTGRAKGVNLGHAAVATNVSQRESLLPTRPEHERVLAITPLFHSYASAMGLYLAVFCRGTLVILPRYHPAAVLDAIGRERITLFSGSPTIFAGLMGFEGFAGADFSSLELCFSGSAALSEATLQRWEAATGTTICEGYGQTEAGPVLTYNPRFGRRKPGSVGVVVEDTVVEIVDVATGRTVLPPGERGEIRARGPQLMEGYRNRPEETQAALRDGWLYTSDIGWLDDEGYLTVCDRKKDMVIVSGFNVYPREVEEALQHHPAVAEAAVVGMPDAYRGEQLRALVVLRPGIAAEAGALTAHLQERLARYKVPQSIDIVASLPKTVIGKVDKQRIRAMP
jgi:long-chain acyl-CoA synthetase